MYWTRTIFHYWWHFMSSPATFTCLINGMFWVNVNLWIINKLRMKTWGLDDQSVYGWFLLFKCLVEAPEQTHISWAGGTSNDTHCTLKEGRSCPCLEDSLSWCTTREAQFISTFRSKCINIIVVSYKLVQYKHVYLHTLREGFKKKQKKSCNIVTTPVHLPTYPYWCTEGNFFNFF